MAIHIRRREFIFGLGGNNGCLAGSGARNGPKGCGELARRVLTTAGERGGTMNQHRRDFLEDSARLSAFALTNAAVWRIEPVIAQSGQGHELATMHIVELAQLLASQK